MANTLAPGANTIAGLGDFQYTVVNAGFVSVQVKSTIPHDSGSSLNSAQTSPTASALQIVIKQNSTTLVTVGGAATNPTPSQPSMSAGAQINCAAGDVIHVVLSSANAVDNLPNAVKSSVVVFRGQ